MALIALFAGAGCGGDGGDGKTVVVTETTAPPPESVPYESYTQPALVSLVALGVGGVAKRVHRRLQERPAQIARALLVSGPRRSDSPDCTTRGQTPV